MTPPCVTGSFLKNLKILNLHFKLFQRAKFRSNRIHVVEAIQHGINIATFSILGFSILSFPLPKQDFLSKKKIVQRIFQVDLTDQISGIAGISIGRRFREFTLNYF